MKNRLKIIHETSMTILENVGIRLHHPDIVELARNSSVKAVGDVVFFTRKQLMEQLEKAPSQFTVYARNPEHDMVIGDGSTQLAAGYGCPAIVEADGSRRNGLMSDYVKFVKLVQKSPGFLLNGGILIQPSDVPADKAHLLMTYASASLSDKCIMGQPGTAKQVEGIMTIAKLLFGGENALVNKPRIITLVNTLSPLQIDRNSLETISLHARYGQPLVICSGVMTGTTSPVTLAGSIAQANAETLVGMAITQIIRPGTPVVMGINATPVDMRTGGVNVGSPAQAIAIKYCAGLARMYGVPIRCGGTSSSANGVTAQSGYESMLNMLVSLEQKVDLIIHSAGILDGYSAMSYEKFITDLEVIALAEDYLKDMTIDENSLALEAIEEVGRKKQFLSHSHTMKNCRKETWVSDIAVSGLLGDSTSPHDALMAKINKKLDRMLNSYEVTALDKQVQEELVTYMLAQGLSREQLQSVQ